MNFFFFITEQVKRRGKLGGKQTQSLPEKVIFTLIETKLNFELMILCLAGGLQSYIKCKWATLDNFFH